MVYLKYIAVIVLAPAFAFAAEAGHGPSVSGFFWRVLVFAVFAAILYKLLAERIRNMLASSVVKVKESIDEAERACAAADNELAEYSRKIAGMAKELEAMKASARNTAEREVELMIAEADKTAEKYREMARSTIESEMAKAVASLKAEIAAMAVENAEKALEADTDEKAKQAYIADSIQKIGM